MEFNAEDCFYRGEHHGRWVIEVSGFGSWLLAECPKGNDNKCMGFDNRLSRSSTLIDFQDV